LVKYRYWAAAWFWRGFFGGGRFIWGALYFVDASPSIATHMSAGLEAPGIDWQKEFVQCLSKV